MIVTEWSALDWVAWLGSTFIDTLDYLLQEPLFQIFLGLGAIVGCIRLAFYLFGA